jgi:hypothetical protein
MPENAAKEIAKTLKLVALDFALAPMEVIQKELSGRGEGGVASKNNIYARRQTDLYKETLRDMEQAWKEQMLKTPGTTELRKNINYGLSIAVKKLIHILSQPKTPNRDLIGAARLMAQMDGRFLGHDAEEARAQGGVDTESVAQELLTAIKRSSGSIQ